MLIPVIEWTQMRTILIMNLYVYILDAYLMFIFALLHSGKFWLAYSIFWRGTSELVQMV